MGAAPSRETIEHSLPQPPFYGQRQQIVLIPLLKKFFPSADCSLFVQLYEARCDPAVRYYYYANDGVEGISRTPPTSPLTPMVRTATEGFDEDESPLYLADKVGNVPFHCPPMDVFPGTPFTREAMYDAYVTNGGEKLVYDTDAEMLRAYRDDPSAVRPLPCAVAFLYHKSMSHAPAVHSGSAGEAQHGGGDKGGDAEAHAAGAAVATSFPEDCSEVLGCYVKATGFMGDVQCLGQRHTRGKTPSLNYEMQMFLTKSAGDHNRTHVLLTAVYTYAEQWQRACLHCVPFDLTGQRAPPNASTEGTAEHGKRLDDAAFFYKAFTQTHEMLVEASRAGGHHPHGTSGATGSGEDAGEATNSTPTTTAARLHDAQNPSRYWAPPPLSALVLRSRRANVPLLCFLREVRACIANMFLFHVKYYYHEHQHERQDKESTEEMVAAAAVGGNISVRPTLHPDMLPHGCWHMWMQNTLTSSAEIDEMSIESVLNVHCTARFMQSIVEYIVACLLHNLNPLEAFRAQPNHGAAVHANANGSSGAGAEAAAEVKVVVKGEGKEGRDAAHASAEAAATTTAALVPHSLSLFRLPDEDMLVGTWPPRPVDQLAELPSKSVEADILTKWRDLYTRHYLFWVIGPNVESRRSATVALLDWVQTRQSPVRWGYHLDEHDREIPSTPSDAYKNNISTAIYPSSSLEDYLCTVTINGTEEETVRGDTVLCLMPVDADATPESRVLRVCRLPLEELLLGELRNASKLAREAGPDSPRWVRQTPSPGGAYKGCVLHAHDPAAGDAEANAVVCSGVELPAVPPEADGIVGDGTSCLWRVDLLEQIHRVIAVTPQFLKPIRKKHPKKKKLPAKAVVAHGTATQVFLAAPAPSTGENPTGGAAEPMKDTAVDTKSEITTSGHEREAAGAAAVVVEEEAAETMPVATPEPSEAVSKPATTTMSKNQKKKAKKAAAAATAAAAVECSADATAAARNAAAAAAVMEPAEDKAAKAEEDPAFTTNKADAPAAAVHPEPDPDSPVGASASKKVKKAQAAKQTLEKSPDATTKKVAHADAPAVPPAAAAAAPLSTETAKSMPKPPQPIAPLPPIPAGEIDPNAVDGNKSRSSSQRTPVPAVKSVSPAAASTSPPTPHYPAGYWGYGAAQAHPAAHPPGYNGYVEPPSYDIYAYAPPPPPPPMPAAAAAAAPAAGAYGVYDYDTHNAYAQTGAPPPPPPFNGHGGGRVPPGYANYYYAQGGYASGYAPEDGYRGASYDEGYGAMSEGEAGDVRGNVDDVGGADQGLYACEGGVVHVAEQIHEELVTLTAPGGTDAAPLAHAGREESDAHTTQLSISRQDTTSSSYQRHVSFGTEAAALTVAAAVEEAANGAVPSSHLARAAGTVVPPLPLCEEMAASPIHAEPGPNASHGGMDKPRGSGAFSPQHSQSVEDNNAASLSVGGSNLHFQTDELHSLITNSSSVPAIPVGVHHHARYVSSPYQQQVSTFEDAGVVTTAGAGPAGSSVNVHVRVRHHHHHTHSRTTSFFSDSTADHANHHAHPTTAVAAAVIGEGSISGLHPSHSFASMGSSSIVFHGVGGTAGSNHAGSMRERAHSGVGGDYGSASRGEHSAHSHPQRPHIPGAASSTRSGETTSTARLMDKRSGTYRWDWRTAGLDMGEED